MNKSNLTLGVVLAALAAVPAGCSQPTTTADQIEARKTAQQAAAAAREVGQPAVTNFYEKRLLKDIYERRDQADLGTFAYVQGLNGKLTCLGKAIGYGVPYSTQYVNPERVAVKSHHYGALALPQPEPNGLFTPDGMSATWLQLVDPQGDVHVVYVEPTIVVSPFELSGPAVAAGC